MLVRLFLATIFFVAMKCSLDATAANIAVNPGFEIQGNSPLEAQGWNSGGIVAERRSTESHSDDWSFYIAATNVGGGFGQGLLGQSTYPVGGLPLPSLQESTEISLSFWTNHNQATGESGRARIQLVNSAGLLVDEHAIVLQDTAGQWVEHVIDPIEVPAFGPPPSDAYYYQIIFSVDSQSSPNSFIEAYIDDVVVEATLVPESIPLGWPTLAFASLIIKRRYW